MYFYPFRDMTYGQSTWSKYCPKALELNLFDMRPDMKWSVIYIYITYLMPYIYIQSITKSETFIIYACKDSRCISLPRPDIPENVNGNELFVFRIARWISSRVLRVTYSDLDISWIIVTVSPFIIQYSPGNSNFSIILFTWNGN